LHSRIIYLGDGQPFCEERSLKKVGIAENMIFLELSEKDITVSRSIKNPVLDQWR